MSSRLLATPAVVTCALLIACALAANRASAAPADSSSAQGSPTLTTHTMGLGQVYRRTLHLERFRFRRDGDPLGGKGEVTASWTAVPTLTSPTFQQSGSLGQWEVQHSRRSKKCSEDGCTNYSDSDCRWYSTHLATFDDWGVDDSFCNPIAVDFQFTEHDGKRSRLIGQYTTNGSSVSHLTSPAPNPSNEVTQCTSGDMVNTLGGKPARIALQWNVQPKLFGSLAGQISCDTTEHCGEIDNYQFGQMSGSLFESRMLLQTVNLDDNSFTGTRRLYFLYDTDSNPATGDQVDPFCGADYRVQIEMIYSGSGSPQVTPFIEVFTAGTWQLSPGTPIGLKISGKVVDFDVLRSAIGNPPATVTSWSVFEQNNIVSGKMPCNPCIERTNVPLTADHECPSIVAIDDAALVGGDEHAAVIVHFSEPMAVLSPSDFSVIPSLPLGTSLTVTQPYGAMEAQVAATPAWPPGTQTLVLNPSIEDQSGNAISPPGAVDSCGVQVQLGFCVDDSHLKTVDAGGVLEREVAPGVPVFASGSLFPPSSTFNVYLVQQESLDRLGSPLVDFSSDGPNLVSTNGTGQFLSAPLGVPVAADDYGLVVDVNGDGLLDAGDRRSSRCDVMLNVGPACELPIGPPFAVWSMDQKTGSYAGERGLGLHGLVTPSATWGSGIVGGALTLNGTSTHVVVPNDQDLWFVDTDFSVMAWVRTTTSTGTIVTHSGAGGIGYTLDISGGKPRFAMNDGSGTSTFLASSSATVADGAWHLISVTADRASVTGLHIYRDNALVFTGDPTPRSGTLNPSGSLGIGGTVSGTQLFSGKLDEVMLFDESLTFAEVANVYARPFSGACLDSLVSVSPDPPASAAGGLAPPRLQPNPAGSQVTLGLTLPGAGWVDVELVDVSGRLIARLPRFFSPAGSHQLGWGLRTAAGGRVAPGVYRAVVRWSGMVSSSVLVVLK